MEITGKIYNPATGEELADRVENSFEELKNAVEKSRSVQKAWAGLHVRARVGIIGRLKGEIYNKSEELARIISQSTGKTLIDALSTELLPGMLATKYYCKIANSVLRPEKIKRSSIIFFNKRSISFHEPLGVIGIISPWNYPFAIPFHEIIMALLAGNGVILKVATQAQPVGDAIYDLVSSIGLPDGLFSLIHMPGSKAGNAFLASNINKLFFTGSVKSGKELLVRAAETFTPVCLELGGNDPMIVLEDANITRAVNGALWAGISNCGQSCGGVERLYVHEKVYEEFSVLLKKKLETMRQGYSMGPDYDFGSLASEKQKKTVEEHIRDAIDKGADILSSTKQIDSRGYFHPAVILRNVDNSMMVVKEETFGPVIAMDSFKTDEEALEKANQSNLGLTASVWTRDKKRGEYFIKRLEAGTVTLNDHLMTNGMAETVWGGYKESGMGRTHGKEGFLEMTRTKSVTCDLFPGISRNLWWYPHDAEVLGVLNSLKKFLFGQGKLRAIFNVIRIFIKSLILAY